MNKASDVNVELGLLTASTSNAFHSKFLYPGCEVEAKLNIRGLKLSVLYTLLVRHVGVTGISDQSSRKKKSESEHQSGSGSKYQESDKRPKTKANKVGSSSSSYSDIIRTSAIAIQIMCITQDQLTDLPDQVSDNIKLHVIDQDDLEDDGDGDDDDDQINIIQAFTLTLSPRAPSSCDFGRDGFCKNFIEVKCFSSEFGLFRFIFPIFVQKVASQPNWDSDSGLPS